MPRDAPAFVPTTGLTLFAGARVQSTCRPTHVRRPPARRATVTMQERTKKKKAAPVFALDIKGNFVWNLRSAAESDIAAICDIVGPNLPESIVSSLVGDSPCCTVCEASVKGTKEGEGFSGRVLGVALADVNIELRESGVVKRADFITVAADPALPDVEDVKRKLALGCLRKLKDAGCVEVTSDIVAEKSDRIELLKTCLFKERSNRDGYVTLACKLAAENPDPEKKMT